MVSIGELILHLTQFEANRSPAQGAFINFLKYSTEPNEVFSASTLDFFYRKALILPYWQNHQDILGRHVRHALQHFGLGLGFNPELVAHAEDYQLISLKKNSDFFDVLSLHDKTTSSQNLKIQYLQLNTKKILKLLLHPTGELVASVIPHAVYFHRGRLAPLCETSRLRYGADLELTLGEEQWLELEDGRSARFFIRQGKAYGSIIKGPFFEQETVLAGAINRLPSVMMCLRALERHFINPQSDPMYQKIVSYIESALKKPISTPNMLTEAEIILKESKDAVHRMFPNDKLLHHLVYKLESQLRAAKGLPSWPQTNQNQLNGLSDSTNTSPIVAWPAAEEQINSSAPAKS